jgi:hypothetical protein
MEQTLARMQAGSAGQVIEKRITDSLAQATVADGLANRGAGS